MPNIKAPKSVLDVLHRLHEQGFSAYAVGGAVRDAILGLFPTDWDITTSALPDEIEAVFADCSCIEVGKKHGVVMVIYDNTPFEITTFRADGDYEDARHPLNVSFSKSIEEDVLRRDFTINTLCWNAEEGLLDFCGGLADIKAHVLRTVGNPDVRFKEDALRILRGLRFAATLGFTIEENTAQAILDNKALLSKISVERIREEFTRLICGNYAKEILLKFPTVMEEFIPELTPLINCAQETPYHCYDVYEHTLVAMMHIPSEPYLRITMFFHDFGKPKCKTIDANGTAHFKGHQKVGAQIVQPILKRLRYDNKMVQRVTFLVSIHDLKAPRNKIEAKILLSKIGAEAYADLIQIKRADNRGKAEPHKIDQKLEVMQNLLSEILEKKECFSLSSLAVNGNDLKPFCKNDGKKIKEGLDFLLKAVILENCPNQKEDLLFYYQNQM